MKRKTQTVWAALLTVWYVSAAGYGVPVAAQSTTGGAQAAQQPPCEADARFRAFDFWVGTWAVYDAKKENRFGTNTIEKQEQGCMLLERWTGASGGTGTSINYYDPAKDKWVQVWVASAGYSIWIEGGLEDGKMRLVGHLIGLNGSSTPFRGTWTPLPGGDVRQFFEQSTDDGATWQPWFEGRYVRQP